MMILRALAPVPTPLFVVPGAQTRDPEGYVGLWQSVWDEGLGVPGAQGVELPHRSRGGQALSYANLGQDSFEWSPEFLTVTLDPAALNSSAEPALGAEITAARVDVYAHGIALAEVTLAVPERPDGDGADSAWLDQVEATVQAAATNVATRAVEAIVEALIRALATHDRRQHYVEIVSELSEPRPMWVGRALLVGPSSRDVAVEWTREAFRGDANEAWEALRDGRSASLMQWLNYGFIDDDAEGAGAWDTGRFSDEWSALRRAQVVYASLDAIDSHMAAVLAEAATVGSRHGLERLRSRLVWLSRQAEVLVVDRQHLEKFMRRGPRGHYDALLETWEFFKLVEQPTAYKIELARRRLDELSSARSERAGVFTDLILLGIGVTSIASTALALSEFGRSAASDPSVAEYDVGAASLTTWFASQPVDVVLVASSAASAILVALYLFFRRDARG